MWVSMPRDVDDAHSELITTYHESVRDSAGRYLSGDGTWTADHVIAAVVSAGSREAAAAKATAAFAHREEKPDPLFAVESGDTFELLDDLTEYPEQVPQRWVQGSDIIPVESVATDFGEDKGVSRLASQERLFNEFGEALSPADLESKLEGSDDLWLVLGLSLEPTGAGMNNERYIGTTATISCPTQGRVEAECINIIYDEREEEHIGTWECSGCRDTHHGPHPEDVVDQRRPGR